MGVVCVYLDVRFSVILEGYIFGAGPVVRNWVSLDPPVKIGGVV